MIALDTNILLYAHRTEFSQHRQALRLVQSLATGLKAWAVPWPCFSEFLRVATHPKFFSPSTLIEEAIANIQNLLESPSLSVLSETPRHAEIFFGVVKSHGIRGNHIFDAKIYALCQEHGVSEILTADADFMRFKDIKITNPF